MDEPQYPQAYYISPQFQLQPEPQTVPSPRQRRQLLPRLLLIITALLLVSSVPWIAEQIVYATTRGAERAKAEVAKNLLSGLSTPEQRIPWVAKSVAPSVVGIQTLAPARNGGVISGDGSGVIVDKQGFILTNSHVIENVADVQIQLNDGRKLTAQLVGRDRTIDLAVLKVEGKKLEPLQWGNSQEMTVGDQVVAIGNPYGLGQTVTSGIISATERYNPIPGKNRVQEFLQTDAAINPGNSGGGLFNLHGELIGINTIIFSETGGNLGIGFAIPSVLARKVYEEIIKNGEIKHGWLGIAMGPAPRRDREPKMPNGVVVSGFFAVSPAREGGMENGDIILRWGKKEINNPLELSHQIILATPGTTETVEVLRHTKVLQLRITLGTRPIEIP